MAFHDGTPLRVFIENEAGSLEKRTFDEHTLEYVRTAPVSAAYPFAYGFVIDTIGGDGDAVDCFVISRTALKSGTIVACRPIALLEKTEDGEDDHKIIAVSDGHDESAGVSEADEASLRSFLDRVFMHIPGKTTVVGRLLGRNDAQAYIRRSLDTARIQDQSGKS